MEDLDAAIDRYHNAAAEFIKGNPAPFEMMFSHADDVSVANPFGPVACGWSDVSSTMERASALYRDGEIVGFETLVTYSTPALAFIVEVERFKARVAGSNDLVSVALRTTSILRPEDDGWKVMHRHADPITSARPPESVIRAAG